MRTRDRRARVLGKIEETGTAWVTDLAGEFQVSEMTVRRDLDHLAAEDLVVRIRGGARRSETAHARSRDGAGGSLSIGIVLPTLDGVYRSILAGCDETLAGAHATSRFLVSNYAPELERQLVDELLANGIDGLLIGPSIDEENLDHDYVRWLTNVPVPVTLVERGLPDGWPGPSLCSVRTSFPRGLALGLTHLTELGHSAVAFFGHASRIDASALRRKWEEITQGFGLDSSSSPMLIDRNCLDWQSSREPEQALTRIRDSGATALICRDDPIALTMAHSARNLGIRIPEDLSLITYDNEIATMCDPPLTAISPPKRALGSRASKLVLELVREHREGIQQPAVHLDMDPSVVVRSSTAPPPREI